MSKDRVLVMIPTRDRPQAAREAILSVFATSDASVCVYIDEGQEELYAPELASLWADIRFHRYLGERVGPVASANRIAQRYGDFAAYGLITDDSRMTVPGWDGWLLEQPQLVVSPSTSQGDHVDMPFVAKEWVECFGWFAYPGCYHTGWPTITGVLAEAARTLCKAPRDKFFVQHDMMPSQNQDRLREDARQLYAFFQMRFSTALGVLRQEAMA